MGRRWEAFKSWPLWHPNSWAFVKTYRIFKPFNRFLIIFSLIAGFLVLITCWYIDLGNSKWWHGHAYILNIWAGFTGFLIGAPVAAVILASFTVQREERSALTRVNELSRLAWEEFRTAVHKFASNDRLDALTNGVGDVQRIHDEIVRIIRGAKEQASSRKHDDPATDGEDRVDWLTRSTFTRAETTPQEFEKLKADLGQKAIAFEASIKDVRDRVGFSEDLSLQWKAVHKHWNILDSYVRLQRLEQRLKWFDGDVDTQISLRLSTQEQHPIEQFLSKQDYGVWDVDSMGKALNALKTTLASDKERFDTYFVNDGSSGFGIYKVDGYTAAATQAEVFLMNLRTWVGRVEADNWPKSESKPSVN